MHRSRQLSAASPLGNAAPELEDDVGVGLTAGPSTAAVLEFSTKGDAERTETEFHATLP